MDNSLPPHIETYFQDKENNFVFVSKLNREKEVDENIRMACFLAEKTNENVFILPHIQPTQKDSHKLRNEYFPKGVKQNKNPDFYYRKRFVDGKCMTVGDLKSEKLTKRSIQKKLKYGFEQADDVLLEIPETYPSRWIKDAIKGSLNSSSHYHIVYIKYGNELLFFESDAMI